MDGEEGGRRMSLRELFYAADLNTNEEDGASDGEQSADDEVGSSHGYSIFGDGGFESPLVSPLFSPPNSFSVSVFDQSLGVTSSAELRHHQQSSLFAPPPLSAPAVLPHLCSGTADEHGVDIGDFTATNQFTFPNPPLSAAAPTVSVQIPLLGSSLPTTDSEILRSPPMAQMPTPYRRPQSTIIPQPLSPFPLLAAPLRAARPLQPLIPPLRVPSVSRRRTASTMSPVSLMSPSRSPKKQMMCSYCASIGKDAGGHTKSSCPTLARLDPCSICGASGESNHTAIHCPKRPRVELPLKFDERSQ